MEEKTKMNIYFGCFESVQLIISLKNIQNM